MSHSKLRAAWHGPKQSGRSHMEDVGVPLSDASKKFVAELAVTLHGLGYQTKPGASEGRLIQSHDRVLTSLVGAEKTKDGLHPALTAHLIQKDPAHAIVMLDEGAGEYKGGHLFQHQKDSVRTFDDFAEAKSAITGWAVRNLPAATLASSSKVSADGEKPAALKM